MSTAQRKTTTIECVEVLRPVEQGVYERAAYLEKKLRAGAGDELQLRKACVIFERQAHKESATRASRKELRHRKLNKEREIKEGVQRFTKLARKWDAILRGYYVLDVDGLPVDERQNLMKEKRRARIRHFFPTWLQPGSPARPPARSAVAYACDEIVAAMRETEEQQPGDDRVDTKGKFDAAMAHVESQQEVQVNELKRLTAERDVIEAAFRLVDQTDQANEGNGAECGICFEDCAEIVVLPCTHHFCSQCATNHIRTSGTCPQCRAGWLSSDDLLHVSLGGVEDRALLERTLTELEEAAGRSVKCTICKQLCSEVSVLPCAHFACRGCSEKCAEEAKPCGHGCAEVVRLEKCLNLNLLLQQGSQPSPESPELAGKDKEVRDTFGAKMLAVVRAFRESVAEDEKAIVFVQWKDVAEKVAESLEKAGIVVFDVGEEGDLDADKEALREALLLNESKAILMCDEKLCASYDLNELYAGVPLTEVSHVMLVHPLEQSTLIGNEGKIDGYEEELIGQIARYGQTRKVHVHRFKLKGTIEDE